MLRKEDNMTYRENARIIRQNCIAQGVYDLLLDTKDIAANAVPGQFVSVYSKDGSRLLPRPISICEANGNELRLVYRVVGKGTAEFCEYKENDTLDIMGPLGNGYELKGECPMLLGGGIGIPPMLKLAQEFAKKGIKSTVILGYRDNQLFLKDEFDKVADVYVATEDGSEGTKGNVLDAVRDNNLCGDIIYSCGPTPMLRAIKAYGEEKDIETYVSLEEKMACGVGACLACVCKTKHVDEHSNVNNARICKDGPVFNAKEVEL